MIIRPYILTNKMQKGYQIYQKLRKKLELKKGLVISATVQGKTYLSAFDVYKLKPKKYYLLSIREPKY